MIRRKHNTPVAITSETHSGRRRLLPHTLSESMRHLDWLYGGSFPAKERFELIDQVFVPPPAPSFTAHCLYCFFMWKGLAVRTVSHQGIVNIGDLQDSRGERNLVALQSIGISSAIEFFMMMADNGQNMAKRFEWRTYALTGNWMLFHHGPLGIRERILLE